MTHDDRTRGALCAYVHAALRPGNPAEALTYEEERAKVCAVLAHVAELAGDVELLIAQLEAPEVDPFGIHRHQLRVIRAELAASVRHLHTAEGRAWRSLATADLAAQAGGNDDGT